MWLTASHGGAGYAQPLTFTEAYTYDALNRLLSATDTGGWSRSFNYDQYGNMWTTGATGIPAGGLTPLTANAFNAANNQLTNVSYDASGNQLALGADTVKYDAENRMAGVTASPVSGGGGVTYEYDGDGQRITRIFDDGTATAFVYDAFGNLAAEYSSTATPASLPCVTCYLSTDHLGSTRLVTNESGVTVGRHDYLPFGEEVSAGTAGRRSEWNASDSVKLKFTGKERDSETGLDFFGTRYFSGAEGRFTSPDNPFGDQDPSDPQSWNMYGYVRNNPLSNVDPTGNSCVGIDGGSYADNGDGNGCAAAGVGAGNPLDSGTLNQGQINAQSSTSAPYGFGEQAFVGFYNLFFNGQLSGAVDLAQGLLELHPANIGYSAAAHLCSGCGNAALAVAALRGSRGGFASVLKGKLGVQKAIAEIEAAGGTVLGTEVKIKTSVGTIRADVVYQDAAGNLVIGEAKNGPTATFNGNQILHGYPGGGPINGTVIGQTGGDSLPPGTPLNNIPVMTFKY